MKEKLEKNKSSQRGQTVKKKIKKNKNFFSFFIRTKTDIYHAPTDTWTSAAASSVPRLGPGLANVGGRIFAFGAYSSSTQVIEEFIPSNNTWYVLNCFCYCKMHLVNWHFEINCIFSRVVTLNYKIGNRLSFCENS